jgi:hypothetical protein
MTRIGVTIPTLGRRHTLNPLVDTLLDAGITVALVDTGRHVRGHALPHPGASAIVIEPAPGPLNIHTWWNVGLDALTEVGCTRFAVLNDDVAVDDPTFVHALAHAAADGISYITPPWAQRETPMTGWAFGIDATIIRPDPLFSWWWGEHDLYLRAQAMGLPTRAVETTDVRHLRTDDAYEVPHHVLRGAIDADRVLFTRRWPEHAQAAA